MRAPKGYKEAEKSLTVEQQTAQNNAHNALNDPNLTDEQADVIIIKCNEILPQVLRVVLRKDRLFK
jgi:hypothetical protein